MRKIMDRLKMPFVFPEEIVHYSEWVHAMRDRIAERQVLDLKDVTVTVHPACHYISLLLRMPFMTGTCLTASGRQSSAVG